MKHHGLDAERVHKTIELLRLRIQERFPDASLGDVIDEVMQNSKESQRRMRRLRRPHFGIRILVIVLLAAVAGVVIDIPFLVKGMGEIETYSDLVNVLEPSLGAAFFISAFVVFLTSLERNRKRNRVLEALHEYRAFAHVIDMHQLTKDPQIFIENHPTKHSPKRDMTPYELSRYFDYCGEALALISKLAALYAEQFPDQVVTTAVDEIEGLSSGLSEKVWQKTMLIQGHTGRAAVSGDLKSP